MKKAYGEPNFKPETTPLLTAIVREVDHFFEDLHLPVTDRQIYYRIRDQLPDIVEQARRFRKSARTYKWEEPGDELYTKVCEVVGDGRDGGLIDWDSIIDPGRNPIMPVFWDSAADLVADDALVFKLDRWRDQASYVEVWTEKVSHVELVKQATAVPVRLYVPIQMGRGYGSDTAVHDAVGRFVEHKDKRCVILYAGDHDASGMDIDRDITERLAFYGAKGVYVRRVALTTEQASQHNLASEKLNHKDTRAAEYFCRFEGAGRNPEDLRGKEGKAELERLIDQGAKGSQTWELDALDPAELQRLIRSAVEEYINQDTWAETEADEEKECKDLQLAADHWPEVVRVVRALRKRR